MKLKYTAFALAAALLLNLAACGYTQPAPQAAEPAPQASGGETLMPLATFSIADPMTDGIYHAGFGAADIEEHEGGYVLTAELYAYDQYDMVEVNSLAAGSAVRTHTGSGSETQDIIVETLDTGDSGLITINGGVEEGGMYLMPEDTVYRTLTMNDYPVYYSVGKVMLPLAMDVLLSDGSAEYGAEPAELSGDTAAAEAVAADETGFTCYNTTLLVENGEIVRIDRIWVP